MSSDGSHQGDDYDERDEHAVGETDLKEGDGSEDELFPDPQTQSPVGKKGKRKHDAGAMRKAPQAPKRFKSSYICFFMAKQPEIKEELGGNASVAAISKRSAELWKTLPPEARAHWEEVAANDKQRYMVEKSSYSGPWHVPWQRAKKDPSAPKRPMSAFLYFSQGRRAKIKNENLDMKNTDVSRILGEMWRTASEEDRRPFVDKEKSEREKYKVAMAKWKEEFECKKEAERKSRSDQMAMPQEQMPPHMGYPDPNGHPYYMYPPPPSYGYPPYMPPVGAFPFPGTAKGPVILGPNGTPIDSTPLYPPPLPQQVLPQESPPAPPQLPGSHYASAPEQSYEDSSFVDLL